MNPFGSDSDKAREIITDMLSDGRWYAPHEIHAQVRWLGCDISPESSSARMRDLKKPQYGKHPVIKRWRAGPDYYEYRIATENKKVA